VCRYWETKYWSKYEREKSLYFTMCVVGKINCTQSMCLKG
jgi:hypothetical protein